MTEALAQGAVIGILGGGQLGRMLSVAASRLGFKTCVYEPGADCPASHVSNYHFQKPYRVYKPDRRIIKIKFQGLKCSFCSGMQWQQRYRLWDFFGLS